MSTFARLGLTILIAAFIAGCQMPYQTHEVVRPVERETELEGLNGDGKEAYLAYTIKECEAAKTTVAPQLINMLMSNLRTQRERELFPIQNDYTRIPEGNAGYAALERVATMGAYERLAIAQIKNDTEQASQMMSLSIQTVQCPSYADVLIAEEQGKTTRSVNRWNIARDFVGGAVNVVAAAVPWIGAAAIARDFRRVANNAIAKDSVSINGDNNDYCQAGNDASCNQSEAGGIPVGATSLALTASGGEEVEEVETDETGLCPAGYGPVDDDGDGVVDRCSDGSGGSTDLL